MSAKLVITKSKKMKGEDGYKVFSIRLKEDTVKKIDLIASQTGRSRNQLIGLFLDFAMKNCTIEE